MRIKPHIRLLWFNMLFRVGRRLLELEPLLGDYAMSFYISQRMAFYGAGPGMTRALLKEYWRLSDGR